MQFLINAYDATDDKALERRMEIRPLHLENMKKAKETGKVICAGGRTNEAGNPVGSFLVLEFETRELLDAYLKDEPYIKHGVWEKVVVETCNVVIVNDEKVGK